jgi:hypothetical protein
MCRHINGLFEVTGSDSGKEFRDFDMMYFRWPENLPRRVWPRSFSHWSSLLLRPKSGFALSILSFAPR